MKKCAAPFRGLAGLAVRPAGYGRSPGNPALCMKCAIVLRRVGNDTAARLASAAGAGELIVSAAAVEAAGTDADGLERRTVEIRGRTQPIEVLVLRPAAS